MSIIVHKTLHLKPNSFNDVSTWLKNNLDEVMSNAPDGWELLDISQRVLSNSGELLVRWKIESFASLDKIGSGSGNSDLFAGVNQFVDFSRDNELSFYAIPS